jgi:hypothetical protein
MKNDDTSGFASGMKLIEQALLMAVHAIDKTHEPDAAVKVDLARLLFEMGTFKITHNRK